MTITSETISNEVEGLLGALVTNPAVSDADLATALTAVSDQISAAVRDLTAPMDNDQRRALFAAFTNVFGDSPKDARKVFTRLVLGKAADAPVSWAQYGDRNGQGALTAREASRVLDALSALEEALK